MMDQRGSFLQQQADATHSAVVNAGLRKYMLGVYARVGMGVLWTGLLMVGVIMTPALLYWVMKLSLLFFIGMLVMAFVAPMVIQRASISTAVLMFWIYATVVALGITPVVALYLNYGLAMDVARAFLIAAVMFGGTSLYGYVTKRDLSGMRGFINLAFWGVLVAIIVNLFLKSGLLSFGVSVFLVLFYAGVTAYQTQSLKNMFFVLPEGIREKAAVMGALVLYASFIGFFLSILRILGFAGGGIGGRQ